MGLTKCSAKESFDKKKISQSILKKWSKNIKRIRIVEMTNTNRVCQRYPPFWRRKGLVIIDGRRKAVEEADVCEGRWKNWYWFGWTRRNSQVITSPWLSNVRKQISCTMIFARSLLEHCRKNLPFQWNFSQQLRLVWKIQMKNWCPQNSTAWWGSQLDTKAAEAFVKDITELIACQGYVSQQVFNCDKTGLF